MLLNPVLILLLEVTQGTGFAQALPIHPIHYTNKIGPRSRNVDATESNSKGYYSVFPTADRSSVVLGILNNAASYPDTVRVKAGGCYRAACFGTSGIYVCNVGRPLSSSEKKLMSGTKDDDDYDYNVPVASLFDDARYILGSCCSASAAPHYPVSGQLFDGILNTIVAVANCFDDPTRKPSEYDGLPGNGVCV